MEFSRREYWSGMLFPSSVDLPNPGIKTALWADSLLSEPPEKPQWREMGAQAPPQMMGGVSLDSTMALSGGAGAVSPPGPSAPLGVPHLILHWREDQCENVHCSFLN